MTVANATRISGSKRSIALGVMTVAAVALMVWSPWSGAPKPGPLLLAMQADPIATYVPPGGTRVGGYDQDADNAAGAKQVVPRLVREYAVPEADVTPAFAATWAAAVDAGWGPTASTPTILESTDRTVRLTKRFAGDIDGELRLSRAPNASGRAIISIWMKTRYADDPTMTDGS